MLFYDVHNRQTILLDSLNLKEVVKYKNDQNSCIPTGKTLIKLLQSEANYIRWQQHQL